MEELVDWMWPFHKVTVFAAYASLGLGTLEHAHKAFLPGWDLVPAVEGDDRILSRSPWPAGAVTDRCRPLSSGRILMDAFPA
ncbi:hypothetical protein ABZ853_22330 [Streptomyces albidoflavus]